MIFLNIDLSDSIPELCLRDLKSSDQDKYLSLLMSLNLFK